VSIILIPRLTEEYYVDPGSSERQQHRCDVTFKLCKLVFNYMKFIDEEREVERIKKIAYV